MSIGRLGIIFTALCAIIALAIFKKTNDTQNQLRLGSGSVHGSYFSFAQGMKEILAKENSPLALQVHSSSGSLENFKRLESGELDFAMVQNGLRSKSPVHVVARLYDEVVHILVPRDSSVETLQDLAGKRICLGTKESGTRVVAIELLKHYGMNKGDYTDLALSPEEATRALLDGKSEALFLITGLRAPLIEKTLATGEVKFLSLGTVGSPGNIAHGIHEHFPHLEPFIIPKHSYATRSYSQIVHPEKAISALTVASLLVCRKDLHKNTVHQVTQALFSQRDLLLRHSLDSLRMRELRDDDLFPYAVHAGADQFYRRKEPSFLIVYSDVLALFLALLLALIGLVSGFQKWRETRRKNLIDTYYERVNNIIERVHHATAEALDSEELKLRELGRAAFQDLVHEKLRANESFRIFQALYESGIEEIQWRRNHAISVPSSRIH